MGQHMCPRRVVLHACCLSLSLPFFFFTSVAFVTLGLCLGAVSVLPCNCCPAKTIILCASGYCEQMASSVVLATLQTPGM